MPGARRSLLAQPRHHGPGRARVSVSDSFGALDASGLHGTVALFDNSGDLTGSRLTGNVRLADTFGTLSASGLAGSLWLDNNSGDIRAAGLTGDTRLQDSFGTISVTGLAAADVVARNSSGDISLTFTQVPRQVNVTDSFGSITLVLPAGPTAYRVADPELVRQDDRDRAAVTLGPERDHGQQQLRRHHHRQPEGPPAPPRPPVSPATRPA